MTARTVARDALALFVVTTGILHFASPAFFVAAGLLDGADDDARAPLFAIATTAYILVAIQLEERDLLHHHGAEYADYRRRVPMLFPTRLQQPAERRTQKA